MKRIVSLALLLVGVSACGLFQNPIEPVPLNSVNYTAFGASDAIGYGSSVPCLQATGCPNGTGYVQLITNRLKAAGKTVSLLNVGIPGAVLSPEIQDIGNGLGRGIPSNILDHQVVFAGSSTTVVTLFTGGNDANTIGAAIEAGLGGSTPASQAAYLATRVANFGRDLHSLVASVKDRAPQAKIVVLNLPNLAGLPYAASYTLTQKKTLQAISVAFSAQMNTLLPDGASVIDLMCDPTFYNPAIFSADGFHPNDSGYVRMADIVYPIANGGVAVPPKASCAQMTMF